MEAIPKKLGKRISELRRKKDLTSEKLAYEMGISKGYLSDIENGKRTPTVQMLVRIAEALQVKVRDLFEF